MAEVARSWGVRLPLGDWVRPDPHHRGQREGSSNEDRVRMRELEAENAKLGMEGYLFKRTVAFWVKESTQ